MGAFSRLILNVRFTCVQTVKFFSFLVSVSLMDCERVLLVLSQFLYAGKRTTLKRRKSILQQELGVMKRFSVEPKLF